MRNNTYNVVIGFGCYKIRNHKSNIIINDILYAPSVRCNLMFVPKINKGFEVWFKSKKVIVGRKHQVCVRGGKIDGMYCVTIDDGNKIINSSYVHESKFNKTNLYV